jgi:hypothetical protein
MTDFTRTDAQLEAFYIQAVVGAGRPTKTVNRQVEELVAIMARERDRPLTPFALLNFCTQHFIAATLKHIGVGLNTQKAQALAQTAGSWVADQLDLRTCDVAKLEGITWVGPKTARFFLLHSRAGARVAVLDAPVLGHLRERGVDGVPAQSPGRGSTYNRLEEAFLRLADEKGVVPVEYDRMVRERYAQKDSS